MKNDRIIKNNCIHELDVENSTIVLNNKTTMVYPPIKYGYCKFCKKTFKYIGNSHGKFELLDKC